MSTYALSKRRPSTAARRANRRKNVKAATLGARAPLPGAVLIKRVFAFSLCTALLLSLCVGLVSGYRWLTAAPYFELSNIEITGNQMLDNGDVLAAAGLTLGQNSLAVNVGGVEASLSASPWVESVAVRRELPDGLRIAITEVEPRFWVQNGDGLFYADAQGNLVDHISPENAVSLPVLTLGDYPEENEQALNAVAQMLQSDALPFALDQVAWVRVIGGELSMHLDGPGLTITLPVADWHQGLSRITRVWADLRRRGEMSRTAQVITRGDRVWVTLKS